MDLERSDQVTKILGILILLFTISQKIVKLIDGISCLFTKPTSGLCFTHHVMYLAKLFAVLNNDSEISNTNGRKMYHNVPADFSYSFHLNMKLLLSNRIFAYIHPRCQCHIHPKNKVANFSRQTIYRSPFVTYLFGAKGV